MSVSGRLKASHALALALAATVGAVASPALATEAAATDAPPVADLPNPPEMASNHGTLKVTLTAAPSKVTVAGHTLVSNVYDGLYTPPTLRLNPGDTLLLTLVDHIGAADVQITGRQTTDLHYHGADVSPRPPQDDIYLKVSDPDSYRYQVDFPRDHPEGLHWYHPHPNSHTEPQILSGMAGMLIVGDYLKDHYPELAGLRQRVMQLKDFYLPGQSPQTSPPIMVVNGYQGAPIHARPGEYQVWMVGALDADAFFDLSLEGHEFYVIEQDGNVMVKPSRVSHILLDPSSRATLVVPAGDPGRYAFRSLKVDRGKGAFPNPEEELGTLVVEGERVDERKIGERLQRPAADVASIPYTPEKVSKLPIARRRTVDFNSAPGGKTFLINGKPFDPSRIDVTTRLGDTECWTIRNLDSEDHTFHMHQTEFLVTAINGKPPVTGETIQDAIELPHAVGGKPGEIEAIIPFLNPAFVGKFVFHCHISDHSDHGMMANIVVLPRKRWPRRSGTSCASTPGSAAPRPTTTCWPPTTSRSISAARSAAIP